MQSRAWWASLMDTLLHGCPPLITFQRWHSPHSFSKRGSLAWPVSFPSWLKAVNEACWRSGLPPLALSAPWEPSLRPLWNNEMAGDTSGLWASLPFSFCPRSVHSPGPASKEWNFKIEVLDCVLFTKLRLPLPSLGHFPPKSPWAFSLPPPIHTGWPRWRCKWH